MTDNFRMSMTPAQFVAKWSKVDLPERAASQEHFIDLCALLGQPTPAAHDATGAEYAFEKGVAVTAGASKGAKGERGFADVWWRDKFAWEYKRKDKYKDLSDAYTQLCQYREALDNPPLLIVSDIGRTEIHTNFTGTAKQVYSVTLAEMGEPRGLDLLRRVFTDPVSLRPTITPERVTEEVAREFAALAGRIRPRTHDPHATAHFLMKCMFCLFAEDIRLLPQKLFQTLLNQWKSKPPELTRRLTDLFAQMRTGGAFGVEEIPWFNGGLFDESPALELTRDEVDVMLAAARHDWGSVEPAVFGTLFERSLDPDTRAQIGAHYTGRDDILLVVEPVVMAPLRREWEQVKAEVDKQLEKRRAANTKPAHAKAEKAIEDVLRGFIHRLSTVRILDPACGSGNFLYVAIQQLLNLEKEVITFGARPEIGLAMFPRVRPTQLHGIEINPYAAELAQVVIWIGYLQWMRDNGFNAPRNPVLEPLQTIENRDAILDLSDPKNPRPAEWPEADFIIGNPPFLGGNLIRQGLGDEYVEAMFQAFDLPNFSDLCCYWFELARRQIDRRAQIRAGLLATQAIRGGVNREVVARIKRSGDIFMAWSDRDWILDGAAVHVSIVGFCGEQQSLHALNGEVVPAIHASLTTGLDTGIASVLSESLGIQCQGDKKGAAFEIDDNTARRILTRPNPTGQSSLEVCRPWANGREVNQRPLGMWIIDFGCERTLAEAASFEGAFEHIRGHVAPIYQNKRSAWWIHERPRPDLRKALAGLPRFLFTTGHSKHRLFSWLRSPLLPDHSGFAFARSDDYFFGVLHGSVHELWARRMGTQLREVESGFRYTPTTCFETFPLPWAPGKEPINHPAYVRISEAAKELNEQRERWLNPPEWIEPIAASVDAEDNFADVPEPARPLIRHSAIMARAAKDPNLKRRTLTNLYNERPTWLRLVHEKLDRAVLAAYAAVDPEGGWSEEWAEVWVETGAGQPLPDAHELAERRKEIDQHVLASLLRLNLGRAR